MEARPSQRSPALHTLLCVAQPELLEAQAFLSTPQSTWASKGYQMINVIAVDEKKKVHTPTHQANATRPLKPELLICVVEGFPENVLRIVQSNPVLRLNMGTTTATRKTPCWRSSAVHAVESTNSNKHILLPNRPGTSLTTHIYEIGYVISLIISSWTYSKLMPTNHLEAKTLDLRASLAPPKAVHGE